MSEEATSGRVVASGDDHPLVLLITNADPTRLKARAREMCDDSWPFWSRSYSGVVALVAGWRHRVGIDIEFLHRANEATWSIDDEFFRSSIMSADEREKWRVATNADPWASATSVWCSKEALAKALGTPLQMDPARLTGPTAWPDASRGRWRATSLDVPARERHAVAWVVYESPLP
jgi:hypothetical protein